MAFQPVDSGALCILEYGEGANFWTNTLWFSNSTFTAADLSVLANTVFEWSKTKIMPLISSSWQLYKVSAYDMRSSTGPKAVSTSPPWQGSAAQFAAPINVAAVVTFYTNQRGRSGRGRNYVAGFPEDWVSATAVSDLNVQIPLQAAYDDLFDDVSPTGFAWGVCQRYQDGVPLASGVIRPVESVAVRNAVLGTQRRRVERP